jgi:general secretion pathway protein C
MNVLEISVKKFRFINYSLIILIVAASLVFARNLIRISFSDCDMPHVLPEVKHGKSLNNSDIMQYAPILEKNPFGQPMKLHPIAIEPEKKQSYGSLSDLTLVGTVVGPKQLSYAIFEDKSPSSPLPGGQEVFAYNQKVSTIKQHSELQMTPSKGSFARKVGEQQYILDSRRVQQSLENPEQLLTDARLLPNFVNGKQEGFKISEVLPDGLYHSLGLRNGDILLRVNGLEISNPEVAMQAMTALKGMNRVNLDIIRDGKNKAMSYQIR